ncbi:uncharacterized protein LOC128559538 [Mercenaria mercenaria]|uniref:uncharacterized protein LOC128559538 n=1 Tax=Mercenaria mercenaria TaxID=6596 RepID=UPI00234E4D4F|nr:uncharacterized protein LOC128559538 [Mercenaria mercenaria]
MAQADSVQYLKDFLSEERNERLKSVLRLLLTELRGGLARSNVFLSRVKATNANSCVCFSEATLDAEVHRDELDLKISAPYVVFFVRGYTILAAFLDEGNPRIPENKAESQALQDLLQFLDNTSGQSPLTENIEDGKCEGESEATLAVRMTHHLLVPLAPHKTFMIDSYPGLELTGCCADEHPMNEHQGDTSFGCRKGWHGRADILLMDDEIPLTVVETEGNEVDFDMVSVSSDSSVEVKKVKKGDDFTPESLSQLLAQAIVNSFVQKGKNPKSHNSMVPGIGLCSKRLIVSLYDCVDDILVTTGPIDLQSQIGRFKINLRTVIILWLALNHGLFGNKTPKQYTKYTAEFHKVVGPVQLEAYMNESEQPLKTRLDEGYSSKYFNDVSEEAGCYLNDCYLNDMIEDVTAKIPFISAK